MSPATTGMAIPGRTRLSAHAEDATFDPTTKVAKELPGVSLVVMVETELVDSSIAIVFVAPAPVAPSEAIAIETIVPFRGIVRLVTAEALAVEET